MVLICYSTFPYVTAAFVLLNVSTASIAQNEKRNQLHCSLCFVWVELCWCILIMSCHTTGALPKVAIYKNEYYVNYFTLDPLPCYLFLPPVWIHGFNNSPREGAASVIPLTNSNPVMQFISWTDHTHTHTQTDANTHIHTHNKHALRFPKRCNCLRIRLTLVNHWKHPIRFVDLCTFFWLRPFFGYLYCSSPQNVWIMKCGEITHTFVHTQGN